MTIPTPWCRWFGLAATLSFLAGCMGMGRLPAPSSQFAVQEPPGRLPGNVRSPGGPEGPPAAGPSGPEHVSFLSQRLADQEDERRILQTRLRQMEEHLQEKDRALAQALGEVQQATREVARTREELQRWQREMTALRQRLRSMEQDNKTTLETIIRTLETFMDQESRGGVRPGGPSAGP